MNARAESLVDNRILISDRILQRVAQSLDIPPGKYKEAVARYSTVGRWLEEGTYPGIVGVPSVFVQGSFRLGTVVRPLRHGRDADYDIDLACELASSANLMDAKDIKQMVGNRLKENATYRKMLEPEGRRCWTLVYAEDDGIGFHLDTLPCVPHPVEMDGLEPRYGEQAIAVTNRIKPGGPYNWGYSNPNGYADWFADRQRQIFNSLAPLRKRQLYEQHPTVFASVGEVPDELVRTPLQRAVQLMKRHRDVRFSKRSDEADKPISIIITTLAAHAYRQERDVFTTLANILDKIQRYQETNLIRCIDGNWLIENPANPEENFAERWNDEGSRKADAFFEWLDWLREDLDDLLNSATKQELDQLLRRAFGDKPGALVAREYDGQLPGAYKKPASMFKRVSRSLLRFDVAHREEPRWHIRPSDNAVRIRARYRRPGFRPTAFQSNCPPLKKGVQLDFEVETSVPKPFTVYWQVVNTGDEAFQAGQLRGDFYDSSISGRNRTESTKFHGMHWVEAFVIKDGACVARSGEFVVNIE